jgi:hypothetical protein
LKGTYEFEDSGVGMQRTRSCPLFERTEQSERARSPGTSTETGYRRQSMGGVGREKSPPSPVESERSIATVEFEKESTVLPPTTASPPLSLRSSPSTLTKSRPVRDQSVTGFQVVLILTYLALGLSALGVTLTLLITSRPPPPLLSFLAVIQGLNLLSFPLIVRSRSLGCVLFLVLLAGVMQGTLALVGTLSMAPIRSCEDPGMLTNWFVQGSGTRCILILVDLGLLWCGTGPRVKGTDA